MKKNHLKNSYWLRGLLPLAAGVALMCPACKKTATPKTDDGQTTNGSKLAVHTSSANAGNADAAFNAYNNAFLVNSGGQTYYKKSISDGTADGTWVASLDILVAEDAYERTGSATHKTLVNNLCNTWLQNTPPPWTWDGWNDDIGWFSLALIRGYQMTGTANFLTQAKYGFDMAYARGWDTQYNGGGIWEQQPDMTPAGQPINKQALSNNSLGKVACLIYQSTHDQSYLTKATQIYDWVWNHIYNSSTGQVYAGIDRSNTVDQGSAVYNQGTFVDFANLLYQITGNVNYYNDAKRSIDYVKNNMTTNGIITNNAGYLNTWGDEFARGLGHFVRDNHMWSTYYPWMAQNATAIWNNRRTDYNITWNGWDQATPTDNTLTTSKFASAVAWLQYTPGSQPDNLAGTHVIVNSQNGIAVDNGSLSGNGTGVVIWGLNNGLSQKWNFTQNEDNSWNIVSQYSWLCLDVPGGAATNGLQLIQYTPSRNTNQRWWVDKQSDGTYKIWNQSTSGALDNSSSNVNGYKLVQWGWNGGSAQRWLIQ
ncbi:glycoside hydrolase family 76 protein [Mucilaginibacter flavus]|uniref:glycoside hydrolase family 76 protein n=1 Tax=Mucilaginibacter flavus TaxID=931504 RepID=UPI0025B5991D|nr:glycoside hydrolase family 76 protein [Mucilaginibacter flavus]MDN3580898.1 RICIN domain-containing protein [Mucilaginibacter flavus]